jgi:hypothetical protein
MKMRKLLLPGLALGALAGAANAGPKLMPGETIGVWCLDKVASDIKKNEGDYGKIFRPAAGLTCPGDEANSITINATEIRLGASATCKLTQVGTNKTDRFGFQCRSTRSNSVWKAAYEIFADADGKQLYVLMLQ